MLMFKSACCRKVSVKNRLTKSAWEMSERFLWCGFLSIPRGTGWNSATLHRLGTAVRYSFEVDEWIQWEQTNSGIMNRGKKLLPPGRALLPALGCLAFLLMASCSSQLPNAFSWCGKRIYSVFPSQKCSQAVFLYYFKSSLLLDLWQRRGSVQAGVLSFW